MTIIKRRTMDDLFLCSFIVYSKNQEKKHEKNEKKKTNNGPNPLTCESHIFDKLDSQIESYAFNTHFCTFKEKEKRRREGFNSRVQFASNESLGLWTLNHH
jgi:hypothetical protein